MVLRQVVSGRVGAWFVVALALPGCGRRGFALIDGTGSTGDAIESDTAVVDIDSAEAGYCPNPVTFDGADRLEDVALVSVASKRVTGSLWFRRNLGFGVQQDVVRATGNDFRMQLETDDTLSFRADAVDEGTYGTVLSLATANPINDQDWHHLLFSFDLSGGNPAQTAHIYLDDLAVLGPVTTFADSDPLGINFAVEWTIGGSAAMTTYFDGDVADFWVDVDTYLDLDVEANRRKFIDSTHRPIDLGLAGVNPTGAVPDVFLSGATSSWATNQGTGGGFVSYSGAVADPNALTTAPSFPCGSN